MNLIDLHKSLNFSYVGSVNSSSKIMKGKKFGIDTYVVYLAPAKTSGYNTCAMSTTECKIGCLNTSGRVKIDVHNMILPARINKTKLFYTDRALFMKLMVNEIKRHKRKAERKGNQFAVRINGTSDLSPELFKHEGKNLLEIFPDVTFYDYTKIPKRIELTKKYSNYDIILSYTGYNESDCLTALRQGTRVAVIFDVKKNNVLPATFEGFPVIDGDVMDYRPMDEKGVVVGLRWKSIKDKISNEMIRNSPFVVKAKSQVQMMLAA